MGFLRRPLAIVAALTTALSIGLLNDRYACLAKLSISLLDLIVDISVDEW